MGKQGPCCHCGISTTPLWRNGPPDKPVLCNACGSRWRTKGTLANYMPMHSGGYGGKSDSTELKLPRVRKGSQKTIERCPNKRKEPCNGFSDFFYGYENSDYDMSRGFEEDASTRSSTGSGISYSESCVQHAMGAGRATECWPPWECPVPSKRRTVMYRQRPSGKGFLNVHTGLHESDSSIYTCAAEEDLLVEYQPSSMTVEIGLGGVFIRPPVSRVHEQESQASSLMFDNKESDHSVALKSETPREESPALHFSEGSIKSSINRGKEKGKQIPRILDTARSLMPNKALLENFPYNKGDVLQSCQSPLVFVELKDIVNIDTFMGLLTEQEQLQLLNHLSSADLSRLPDSLKYMFTSAQFESALGNFQLLLEEGMFDSLESGLSSRVLQHYQQLLTLSDLTTSGWMERCSQIFNRSKRKCALDYAKIMQGKEYLKEKLKGLNTFGSDIPSASVAAKNLPARSLGSVMTGLEDTKHTTLDPSSSCTIRTPINSPSMLSDATFGRGLHPAELLSKGGSSSKDSGIKVEGRSGSCFSADSFHLPNQGMSPSKRYNCIGALNDEVIDPDILLDLPTNVSFQQAELLQQPEWSKLPCTKLGNEQKQNKNGDLNVNNTWNSDDNVDWGELFWNPPSSGSVYMLPNETVLNPGKTSL